MFMEIPGPKEEKFENLWLSLVIQCFISGYQLKFFHVWEPAFHKEAWSKEN